MLRLTQNIEEANLITHGGSFHSADVMATAILMKVFEDATICRTNKLEGKLREEAVIYDIGRGKFDHHQKVDCCRKNRVPYSCAGLIWKAFWPQIVDNFYVYKIVDRKLMQGIDAIDNGTTIRNDYIIQVMSVYHCIDSFNPTWDSSDTYDEAFLRAVAFAKIVLDNTVKNAIAKVNGKEIVEEAIENSENGIMVLETKVPWQEYIFTSRNKKKKDILFVVYPASRGGYAFKAVPAELGEFSRKKTAPKEWRGLEDEELQKVTGIKTALFCHPLGFTGRAETLEDAIAMAILAIEA